MRNGASGVCRVGVASADTRVGGPLVPDHQGNGGISVDPQTFDGLIQRLAQTGSRRSLLGVSVLAALGLGEEILAKKTPKGRDAGKKKGRAQSKKKGGSNRATAEGQLGEGARCDPAKNRHGENHGCKDCRTGFSVAYTNAKGQTVRKCACAPAGQGRTTNEAWQCCSGQSDGSQCIDPPVTVVTVSSPPPPPPSPPGPPGPPGPAGPAGAIGPAPGPVPAPFAGTCVAGQNACEQGGVPTAMCNGNADCFCFVTSSGARFCGLSGAAELRNCGTDAECVALIGPTAACISGQPPRCALRFCQLPCPT
jgi:hypothetical protein